MNPLVALAIHDPSIFLWLAFALLSCIWWLLVASSRPQAVWLFCASVLVIPCFILSNIVVQTASVIRPLKIDLYVYQIDKLFGEPSFVIGRLVAHNVSLWILLDFAYNVLPWAIIATFATYLFLRSYAESLAVLRTFLLNLVAAVPLYLLFPVCGPIFAFPHYPFQEPEHLVPRMLALTAEPNGVPSVHTSSALFILWYLWPWRLGRCIGIVFLVLTILATLGLGEHYFFDLLCAVPYAIGVYWVARLVRMDTRDQSSVVNTVQVIVAAQEDFQGRLDSGIKSPYRQSSN